MCVYFFDFQHQFNPPSRFCWFNLFNNYFFSQEKGAHVLAEFLQHDSGRGIVIVMDPPFGGRVEPLAKTIQEIMRLHRKLCPDIHADMLGMITINIGIFTRYVWRINFGPDYLFIEKLFTSPIS
jgi:hypothetical protein